MAVNPADQNRNNNPVQPQGQPASQQQVQDLKNSLKTQTQGKGWSEKFLSAVDQAGIPQQLTGQGSINPGVQNPFNGMSPQEQQDAKLAIGAALINSPLSDTVWTSLYQAGIAPDQQGSGSTGGSGGASSTGGTGDQSAAGGAGNTQQPGASQPPPSGAGAAGGSGGTGGAGGASGKGGAAGAAGATGTSGAGGATGAAGAGGSTAATPGISGSSQGLTAGQGSTVSKAGAVAAASGTGSFSPQQLQTMINTALDQVPGGDNSLSGPQNKAKWDPSTPQGAQNLNDFYNGIVGAQKQFYPEVPIDQFAKLIVAHSAQESTLNPDIENGDGVIQANQSVRDDFNKYGGKPLVDGAGKTVVTPGSADSKNPGSCVMLWAWRTRSSLDHGGNGPAQWNQNVPQTQSPNFGNALSVWFQGPASQPFYKDGQLDTSGFHMGRIQAYWDKLGGTPASFQQLGSIPLGGAQPGQVPTS